ncbi:hypothetical protein C7S18_20060 [Ahniella affigens]|uniref:Conjugal transfer protein n=1 Tax=Ahniella affigens TaxID=2021234 RepID=A0A2P1PWV2_9GAMM|nr:TrbC family F-type conjugative pilus assembly protein [Ahniella affigens]AVP99323.1 hypothetical protein C7S18_20060 [Ahniella affigens]
MVSRWIAALLSLTIAHAAAETLPTPTPLDADTRAFIAAQPAAADARIGEADRVAIDAIAGRARDMVDASIDEAAQRAALAAPASEALRIRLFVSRGLPRADLAAALALAERDPRITLVFRGLLPNTRLADFKFWLAEQLGPFANLRRPPHIEIDPPAFQTANVQFVPVVALYREQTLLAQVGGMLDPTWLEAAHANGERGPFGARGPVHDIAEPDLISVMQARARMIDWRAYAREQQAALYRSLQAHALPSARQTRTRWHDPSFIVQDPIVAEGTVIAAAGLRVNPLLHLPFTQELWVLDATDPAQWQLALAWQAQRAAQGITTRLTVLTTALPEADSLRWLDTRSRELGVPIQLWRAEFAAAFGIAAVPSRVRAEHARFRIDETLVSVAAGAQSHADR